MELVASRYQNSKLFPSYLYDKGKGESLPVDTKTSFFLFLIAF